MQWGEEERGERERETGGHAGRQIDRFGKVRFIFVSLSKVYSRPYLT
jgi:hypothetical protein